MIIIEIKDNIKTHELTIHMVRKQETRIEEYYGDKLTKKQIKEKQDYYKRYF